MNTLKTWSLLGCLSAAMVWASCTPVPDAVEEEPEYDVLYYSRLARGTNSALKDTTEIVVRDEQEWERVKDQLHLFEEPRAVDFDQAMLVVIGLPVDTGGFQLAVDNVEYGDGKVMVTYIAYEPGGDCLNVSTDVTPFEVAEVRRMDAPVTFTRLREYVYCNRNL